MGSCSSSTQREHVYGSNGRIIPPITEYRGTQMQTTLKSTNSSYSSRLLYIEPEKDKTDELDLLFKPHYRMLLHQPFIHTEQCSIVSCDSIKRVILLFQYHIFLQQRYDSSQCNLKLMEYFDTKYVDFINDYHHLITCHSNQFTRNTNDNNIEYESLYNEILKYIPICAVDKCQHFARHNNYSWITGILQRHDTALCFQIHLLDSIHCYLLHSFDDGFRVKTNAIFECSESESKYDHDSTINDELSRELTDLYHDKGIHALKAYLRRTTAPVTQILRHRIQYNKFHTNYNYRRIIKCKLESVSEVNTNNIQAIQTLPQQQMEQYCEFTNDHKFYYWKHYKSLNVYDNDSNAGYLCSDFYIEPKYDNLKEEVLNNGIYALNGSEYDDIMYKARKLMFSSNILKKIRSKANVDTVHYEVNVNEALSICNIFCVVCYCDHSIFSHHLKSSFRRINAQESIEELKARNAEFAIMSRILRETVECFGRYLDETAIHKLYTSVSLAVFLSFECKFVGITSITVQLPVIVSHVLHDKHSKNGMILELNQWNDNLHKMKYFDSSILSKYPNENEIIFCGANSCAFKFSSIKMIEHNEDYRCFISAIQIFMDAISGKFGSTTSHHHTHDIITKTDYLIIKNLCNKNQNTFPHYINQMFGTLCGEQIEIHIDLYNLDKYYQGLIPILCHAHCSNLVRFDSICSLFTNCRCIKIDGMNDKISIDSFFYLLLDVVQNIKTKCIKIEIRSIAIDIKQYKAKNIESIFRNKKWFIIIECPSLSAAAADNESDNIVTDLILTKYNIDM